MSKELILASNTLPVSTDGVASYLARVNAIPMLTAEEEKELALRYRQEGDLAAAQQLVLSHLRYVARIARSYNGYGLAVGDLIQEGTIGLMKAVKRFDPTVGVRLVSFAVHWIKAEIHEFIIRNWRIVKVATTKAQRKLFFNLRQAKKRLGWMSKQEVHEVANDLGVSPEEVMEMEMRLNAREESFDPYPEEDTPFAPAQYLLTAQNDPEMAATQEEMGDATQHHLHKALMALDARSQDIISERYLTEPKVPLKDLAEKYSVSIERIRQLEKAAMDKLKIALEDVVAA